MSSLRERIDDAVNQHTDVFLLGAAVVVLFLAVTVFLWSRRASRLQRKVEELESSRDALKQLLRRPETVTIGGGRRPEPASPAPTVAAQGGRDASSTGTRPAAVPEDATAPPNAQDPAGAAMRRLETLGEAPAQPSAAADPAGDGATTPESKGPIPESWRSAEQDVTPPAAAWAASAAPARREAPSIDFATLSPASPRTEPAARAEDARPPAAIEPLDADEEPAVVEAPAAPPAPVAAGWLAAVVDPVAALEEPVARGEEPVAVEETPAAIGEPIAVAIEEPVAVDEPSAAVEEHATLDEPAAAAVEPAVAVDEPAAAAEEPAAVDEPAPAIAEPVAVEPLAVDQPAEVAEPVAATPSDVAYETRTAAARHEPAAAPTLPAFHTFHDLASRAAATTAAGWGFATHEPVEATPAVAAETPVAEEAPAALHDWADAPQSGPTFRFGPPPAAADLEPAEDSPASRAEADEPAEPAHAALPDAVADPTDFTLPAHVALPFADLAHADLLVEPAGVPAAAHSPEPANLFDRPGDASATDASGPAGLAEHADAPVPAIVAEPEALSEPDAAADREDFGPRTSLEESYDAWETLSRSTAGATPQASGRPGDPAYTAWSEVTSHGDAPADPVRLADLADTPAPEPLPANGHGRLHGDAPVSENADEGSEGGDLADLTTLARRSTMAAPIGPAAEPAPVDAGHAPAEAAPPVAEVPAPAAPPAPAPVEAAAPRNGSSKPAAAAGDASGGILLVEDDDNVAKIYRLVLESKGHTVRHAADGVAALDEVRSGRPDLVLLDVMMPRMNGILFLQSLRAQPDLRDVPVVILSNFREPRLVERAMALGALEYVVKAQTRPDVLINAIPRWLAGERAFSR